MDPSTRDRLLETTVTVVEFCDLVSALVNTYGTLKASDAFDSLDEIDIARLIIARRATASDYYNEGI